MEKEFLIRDLPVKEAERHENPQGQENVIHLSCPKELLDKFNIKEGKNFKVNKGELVGCTISIYYPNFVAEDNMQILDLDIDISPDIQYGDDIENNDFFDVKKFMTDDEIKTMMNNLDLPVLSEEDITYSHYKKDNSTMLMEGDTIKEYNSTVDRLNELIEWNKNRQKEIKEELKANAKPNEIISDSKVDEKLFADPLYKKNQQEWSELKDKKIDMEGDAIILKNNREYWRDI